MPITTWWSADDVFQLAHGRTISVYLLQWFGRENELIFEGPRMGAEALALLASPLFRGQDVPRGAGRPVLLIPGFMAGDSSLAVLNGWLRRQGFRVHGSGISRNVECSEKARRAGSARRSRELSDRYEQPVAIIGHSRGGTYGRVLAVRHPELVDHVITLGSPLVATMDDFHPLLRLNIRTLQALQKLAGGGLIADACEESWQAHKFGLEGVGCCYEFWADLEDDMPAQRQLHLDLLAQRRRRALARLPRSRRDAPGDRRLALRHGAQRQDLPRDRRAARAGPAARRRTGIRRQGRRAGQRGRRRLSRPPATLRQWQAVVPLSVKTLPASGTKRQS